MEHGDIVLRLLAPPDQNPAKTVHPAMRTLHDPTPRFPTSPPLDLLGLLAAGLDVRREAEVRQDLSDLVLVIPLIQAQALRLLGAGLGALDGDALQGCRGQLHVVAVGPVHGQPDRDAVALDQQAALDALLGTVGGIFPGLFLPRGVPWSCTRPGSATSSRCPSARRIRSALSSTSPGRHLRRPTPGSGQGRWSRGRTWSRPALSTGSRFAGQRRWHPDKLGRGCAAGHRRSDACSRAWARGTQSPARGHRGCANHPEPKGRP